MNKKTIGKSKILHNLTFGYYRHVTTIWFQKILIKEYKFRYIKQGRFVNFG